MKFWIITPTYNRYELLKKSINSVLSQSYDNFELIVIDDSTNNFTFENIKKDFQDNRIIYIKNKKNSWVNYSRNVWLDSLSKDIDFVVFLDDDDYFDIDCLKKSKEIIEKNPNFNWFFSNRKWITQVEKYNTDYNYFYDYFIWKKIKWDATHFIKKDIIWKIRFSKFIKQWQEWLFYVEIWEKNNFFAYDFDSTISNYLPWWLTDLSNKKIKIFLWNASSMIECIFLRKNTLKFKFNFLKIFIIWSIKKILFFKK